MNTITGLARLTDTPELTKLPGTDTSKLTMRLAERKAKPQGKGDNRQTHNFYSAEVFGPYADHLAKSLDKGSRISYRGELDHQTWTAQGERRGKYVLRLDQVEFADPRRTDGDEPADDGYADAPAPAHDREEQPAF
ncbi:MAG: single-stranded DNA-binding protein [Solirubrobacteraceae bacterium]|nr:single-stranded DNA-binding protein [Solirubrobacteraceae bacterium]